MTKTVISSASREVTIGFGQPFVMIGERINPTGRKLLAAEVPSPLTPDQIKAVDEIVKEAESVLRQEGKL